MSDAQQPPHFNMLPLNSDDDAAERYRRFRSLDPFPNIAPALLNSADIEDYVNQVGMIYPFEPRKALKSASYEVPFDGLCRFWDENGKMREQTVHNKDTFELPKNSIAFVQPKTKFRLPNYVAIRFNLQITHVHRGLLLGTGPLIDPGFEGQLLIPIHNLTTNSYVFRGGEGLIWIEFTKISPNPSWDQSCVRVEHQKGQFEEFRSEKRNRGIDEYLARAAPNRSIQSSVGEFLFKAEKAESHAKQMEASFGRLTRIGTGALLIAFVALSVSLGLLYFSLVRYANDFMTSTDKRLQSIERQLEDR